MQVELNNLEETREFGYKFGKLLKESDVVCLNGDLGAGKTTLTKSIGLGLDVEDYITSPTFALINIYEGRHPLYHFDVYRLENVDELYDLGFDEYFYGKGVSIIEWSDRIKEMLPKERIELYISKLNYGEARKISLKAYGKRYEKLIEELEEN